MSGKTPSSKRVTVNFERPQVFGPDALAEFNQWKNSMIEQGAKVAYDRRNNIYCVSPTMDYEMYYNYAMYLNTCRSEWLSSGYFDMGMVPFIMWPSFMDASPVMEQMRNLTRTVGINLVSVPAVSLLKSSYTSIGQDYWIFREDLLTLMRCLEQSSPMYKFNVNSIEEATLSNFLKPLADISRAQRGGNPV